MPRSSKKETNSNSIPGMFTIKGEPKVVTEARAKILEAFKDLEFDEPTHTYRLNGNVLPSVTTVLHKFEQPFDGDTIAERYAEKNGFTKEYWLDQWKFKNLTATISGTFAHEWGESLFYIKAGQPDKICESCKAKYVKDKNWLIPTRPKEEAILKFYEELNPNLHLLLPEAKMFTGLNKEKTNLKQDLAGTGDILFYYVDPKNPDRNGIAIFDYKTNSDLTNDFSRNTGKTLLPPFDDMISEPKSIYELQLSTYTLPLEDLGLKVIARRLVWLKPDGNYEIVPVGDRTEILRETL